MIGSVVDQFKLTKLMGTNAVGEYYLAQHLQAPARFVLFMVKPEVLAGPDIRQRLLAEVSQLCRLNHPNLVSPVNLIKDQNRLFLVTDHVEGQSLAQLSKDPNRSLALEGILRIFKDVLRGFGYAHTEGLVHVMLSPNSVMVTPDSEARILGFGTVLQREKERRLDDQQKLKYVKYFAPERFSHPDLIDVRSNIYSLGVLLYELVTGQPPISGTTAFEFEIGHQQTPVPDPRSVNQELPESLSTALMTALAKKPEQRFQTTLEFYKEIEKVESMRRSELFSTDFVKGFGEIDSVSDGNDVMDVSESFKIEDAFDDSSLDMGFDLPSENSHGAQDLFQKETIRDENISPEMFALPGESTNSKGESVSPSTSDDWEQAFEATMSGTEAPPSPESSGFDFADGALEKLELGASDSLDGDPFGMPEDSDPFASGSGGFEVAEEPESGFQLGEASEPRGFDLSSPEPETRFSFGGESPEGGDAFEDPGKGFGISADPGGRGMADSAMGVDESVDQTFSSDDGAFTFEVEEQVQHVGGADYGELDHGDVGPSIDLEVPGGHEEDGPPLPEGPMPSVRRSRDGLKDSLDAADRAEPVVVSAVRVRKMDWRLVGIVVVLLAAAGVAGFLWFQRVQARQVLEAEVRAIRGLASNMDYDAALARIQTQLDRSPGGDIATQLKQIRVEIEAEKMKVAERVETLLAQASHFEMNDKTFTDGKNDAFGAYIRALELDSRNEKAGNAVQEIVEQQMLEVERLIETGDEVQALRTLGTLSSARPEDDGLRNQYGELKARLVEEKSGQLQQTIRDLFDAKKFTEIPEPFSQLRDIDARSAFLKEMKVPLLDTFTHKAQDARSKQKYSEALDYIYHALTIDPGNRDLEERLAELEEETVRHKVEVAQDRLERATMENDLAAMHRYATELDALDPGNSAAGSALIRVNEEVGRVMDLAVEQRNLGQFKKAAGFYRQAYKIKGDEAAKMLAEKYERWSPPVGMSYVPGGRFRMGFTPDLMSKPSHYVEVSPFVIDTKEVTNAEFKRFVDQNPAWSPERIKDEYHNGEYLKHWEGGAPRPGTEDRPVVYVSWFAAQAYAQFVGKRLPRECEWEMAAAGGTRGQKYWWGNYSDAKKAVYEFYIEKRPAPVGSFPPNGYNLFEILGNVSEWVQDSYTPSFYSESDGKKDPVNVAPSPPAEKVFRGGSYLNRGRDITIYRRFKADPGSCLADVGFRCANSFSVD